MNTEFSKPCYAKPFNPLLFIKSKELKSEIMQGFKRGEIRC